MGPGLCLMVCSVSWKALPEVWSKTREQRCRVHYAELRIMPTSVAKPAWEAEIAVKDAA